MELSKQKQKKTAFGRFLLGKGICSSSSSERCGVVGYWTNLMAANCRTFFLTLLVNALVSHPLSHSKSPETKNLRVEAAKVDKSLNRGSIILRQSGASFWQGLVLNPFPERNCFNQPLKIVSGTDQEAKKFEGDFFGILHFYRRNNFLFPKKEDIAKEAILKQTDYYRG